MSIWKKKITDEVDAKERQGVIVDGREGEVARICLSLYKIVVSFRLP